jgi:G6PDH family F420-dependent oxidoreductase
MIRIGYKLSSEEHRPNDLVAQAQRAERCGFAFAMISDHFHPWIDRQGQSPFVWAVIGGIAHATEKLVLGTAVTCPTIRIHPGIVAQAAATATAMMPGRFILGVGAGENLNEHVFGHRWPPALIRREMLQEAVQIIRLLWQGEQTNHFGKYYRIENARIYTLPEEPPPIVVAASGPKAAKLAGRIGDGFVSTSAEAELISAFNSAGGTGRPRYGELTVCWAEDEKEARRIAYEQWPIAGFAGALLSELALPGHFEETRSMIDKNTVTREVICGADPKQHLDGIKRYAEAGYDHVFVHQIGPDQEGFFKFYQREILPNI